MESVLSLVFYLALAVCSGVVAHFAQKYDRRALLWLPVLLLTVVAGIRGNMVGVDTASYLRMFPWYDSMGLSAVNREFLFYYIGYAIYRIFGSVQPVFLAFGLLIYALFFFRLWDFRKTANLGISTFIFVLFYFGSSMNGLRQYIAIAIVFYATRYLRQERYILFCLFVALSALFHVSSIICFVFVILYIGIRRQYKFRQLIYLVCFLAAAVPAGWLLLQYYGSYLDDVKETDFGLMSIVRLAILVGSYILCVVPLARKKRQTAGAPLDVTESTLQPPAGTGSRFVDDSSFRFLFLIALLGMGLGLASAFIDFASRAGYYFRVFEIVFFGAVFQSRQIDRFLKILILLALTALGAYSLWTYNGIIPYQTIFS